MIILKIDAKVINGENYNTKKIESFVLKVNSNVIFQTFKIYNIFVKVKNYEPIFLVVENNDDELQGILLAIIQKEHGGILGIFSSRSIIYGGPIIVNNNPEVLCLLLKKYNEMIKRKVIYSQFRNMREYFPGEKAIFEKFGYKYQPHLDIIHNLTKPIEEQWMGLHQGRRKNIRRAEKMGLIFREVRKDTEFEEAYQIVMETYKRAKLPIPDKSLFWESYKDLKENGILKIFIAVFNDEIIATRMVLCSNDLIYDWFAGADKNYLDKYPNDFLPWRIIEWGSKNGYKYFDFGGAGKPNVPYGVREYKIKFGGDLVEYGRFIKNHNPLLMSIGRIGLNIYKQIKS